MIERVACLDDQDLALLAAGESGSSEHVDSCPSCRARFEEVRLSLTRTNPKPHLEATFVAGQRAASAYGTGAQFGRYLVIDRLGAGGMGEVFAAFDPKLDRKVALKLLRLDSDGGSGAEASRERLLREARAMAQLAHPNVAAVHDVGTHDGQVYVAMEFIDGLTLSDWCRASPRAPEETLAMFRQAGRGLAAAHQAGLIHRDFKPANVLVGNDGRVRVLDFGLARISRVVSPVGRPVDGALPADGLTVAGSVMGTPAYMSPEQHDGAVVDARADQYSFCISLYEGLFGERPFLGDRLATIRGAIVAGLPAQPQRRVSARIYAALRRGTATDPADRFPSMEALLEALSNETQTRRRQRLLLATLVLSTVSAAGGLVWREVASRHCASAAPQLAGAWDAARRSELSQALRGSARGAAVQARLDAYAQEWVGLSQQVCEAHRATKETPAAKYVLQKACLDRRLSDLRALTSVLVTADAPVLKGAALAVSGLRPIAPCVKASAEYADSELERGDVEARLSEARALARLGLVERAQVLGEEVREDPLASRRAQAEAWLVLGMVAHARSRFSEAELALNTAAAKGIAAGSFEVAAKAWSLMVDLYGRRLDKPVQAQEKADLAASALTRLGDEPEVAAYYFDAVGRFQLGESRFPAAADSFEKALANAERAWGPDHPEVAIILDDLGWANSWLGRNELAKEQLERALEIKLDVYPPGSVEQADTLGRLAMVLQELGELERAIEVQERALAIRRAAVASPDFAVTTSLSNLAALYKDAGRLEEALAIAEECLRILGGILDGDHLRVVGNLVTRGQVLLALGRLDDGKKAFEEALAMSVRLKGAAHVMLAEPLEGLAETALAAHQPGDAVARLEQALALRQGSPGQPLAEAHVRFLLARALWESGQDLVRARGLLATARRGYEGAGPMGRQRLVEVARWVEAKGLKD